MDVINVIKITHFNHHRGIIIIIVINIIIIIYIKMVPGFTASMVVRNISPIKSFTQMKIKYWENTREMFFFRNDNNHDNGGYCEKQTPQ